MLPKSPPTARDPFVETDPPVGPTVAPPVPSDPPADAPITVRLRALELKLNHLHQFTESLQGEIERLKKWVGEAPDHRSGSATTTGPLTGVASAARGDYPRNQQVERGLGVQVDRPGRRWPLNFNSAVEETYQP